jgi:16S rRNA (cytidine1402-2'-O)-methyltransferase
LYIVATPIGNLDDLSPRARKVLAEVALIAAEDTRHTGRLLSHIGVKTPLKALHDHNEAAVTDAMIAELEKGRDLALVSDAGTPLISDPGYRLVASAQAAGLKVSPIPGPSALTAALSAAGIPSDRFCFEGFLPAKSAARDAVLRSLCAETRSLIFYESVHRIDDSLKAMREVFGGTRLAFVGREISKLHEQCLRGTLEELCARLDDGVIVRKGEFVVVVSGAAETAASSIDSDRLLTELADLLPARQVAAVVAKVTGEKRNALYARLLEIKRPRD